LVLDGILSAHADSRAIGEMVDATNARLFELGPDNKECFAQ